MTLLLLDCPESLFAVGLLGRTAWLGSGRLLTSEKPRELRNVYSQVPIDGVAEHPQMYIGGFAMAAHHTTPIAGGVAWILHMLSRGWLTRDVLCCR